MAGRGWLARAAAPQRTASPLALAAARVCLSGFRMGPVVRLFLRVTVDHIIRRGAEAGAWDRMVGGPMGQWLRTVLVCMG